MNSEERGESKKVSGKDDEKVAFYKLFSLADRVDLALIIVGTLAAVAAGMSQPFMTVIFGELINSFGTVASPHLVHVISRVRSFPFLYA